MDYSKWDVLAASLDAGMCVALPLFCLFCQLPFILHLPVILDLSILDLPFSILTKSVTCTDQMQLPRRQRGVKRINVCT